jgi:hypothetical protein
LLPFDAQHQAVDPGADAEHGHAIPRAKPALFDSNRHRDGQGSGPRIAECFHGSEVDFRI